MSPRPPSRRASRRQDAVRAIAAPDPRRRFVVIASIGVGQILVWGSSYYLLAVLAGPVARDDRLARKTGSSARFSLGLLISGLVSPRVGRLIERFGGRPVLAASAVLLAIGLLIQAAAPNLAVFVAAWLVIGLGMGAGLYDPAFCHPGPALWRARPQCDHASDAVRRLRQHRVLAAQRAVRRAVRLARRVPCLRRHQPLRGAAAVSVRRSARGAAAPPVRRGRVHRRCRRDGIAPAIDQPSSRWRSD